MSAARLLIVEDERITAEDLRDILTEMGYAVLSIVSTGVAAIGEVEQRAPDLVLMDIRIQGDLDGTETARVLRERFDTPVVFLTAHSDEETLSRAKVAEPLGYIVKPFQESELHATVEMALHKSRADRERNAAHDRLIAAVDSLGEAVVCSSTDRVVTFMNSSSQVWTGWDRADALGKSLGEVVRLVKRNGGALELPARRVLEDGLLRELDHDSLLAARDGTARRIGGTLAPIRDHSGRVTGTVFIFGEPRHAPVEREEAAVVDAHAVPASLDGPRVIAKSESMRQLVKFAHRVAASEASTILIEGESGVGKDVVAKLIHENSRRSASAFLAVNCAAIPETLLESELFGYEKGAFTDARTQKRGILELASGGTAFLDEVGELPLTLQAKLLRVLEEHRFRRLGGTKDLEVDLRVIAATNRELRKAIAQGSFRLDLYYRLNVIQMSISPLRERKEDILPLARYFVEMYNRKFGRFVEGIAPDAVSALLAHEWPGNVRELRNSIERAMLIADGTWIEAAALGIRKEAPFGITTGEESDRDPSLAEFERSLLVQALEKTSWNQTRASQILKISRDALRYKMKKFNLRPRAAIEP
jgi:DNA-binding NtrC family response regulator